MHKPDTRHGVTGATTLLTTVCTLLFSPAWALAETPLRPYQASYQTSTSGFKLTVNRELKRDERGRYTLTSSGKMLVAGVHEVAAFQVEDGQVVPGDYIYQGTGLINRRREVHFTPGSDIIRSLYKEKWYELPYEDGTLDRLSQQEQLRLHLLNDQEPGDDIDFRVADGKRIKEYSFVYLGEQQVDTPMGRVDTLHFERTHDDPDRRSETWVAPAWDYLMVRTLHVEDGKPVEARILSASIDGQPVRGTID